MLILLPAPLKRIGQALNLPVHEIPPDRASFRTWEPPPHFAIDPPPPSRLLVSASFGRILSNRLLSFFAPGRRLNVHPSLLPAYRGASPIQYTIMDGQQKTGVCVIEMMERKKGIDAGSIWGVSENTVCRDLISPNDVTDPPQRVPDGTDFRVLRDELGVQGGRLLVSVLRDMLEGKVRFTTWHHEVPVLTCLSRCRLRLCRKR